MLAVTAYHNYNVHSILSEKQIKKKIDISSKENYPLVSEWVVGFFFYREEGGGLGKR